MPRGKGRKRGIGQTNTPRRTTTSSTVQRRPILHTSIRNLRRSTRIADSTAHRGARSTSLSMTDVASRTHIPTSLDARRSIERQGPTYRRRRNIESPGTRSARGQAPNRQLNTGESDQNGYALDFVVGPPSQLSTDLPVHPAVTLQVRTVRPGPNLDRSLHQYLAVATLVTTDANGALVPAASETLGGSQMTDSVHAPAMALAGATSPDILGYVTFPDLFIRSPGIYQMHVALMRIGSPGGSEHGGTTLQTVDSGPIVVSNP
jgi:hypothetical protein